MLRLIRIFPVNYILAIVSEEVNRKCHLRYFRPPAPTLSATVHSITDRQTIMLCNSTFGN